ncbi:fungal specific transcription factor domain-containing protein [Aspergillus mulundensis]|uniref:Putative Zn(II)2Cys6 transcription factor n=1 Tax=Aspergillus mulundensis TaxID=1810919 RepID=A0A3D8SU29_9EURO|nr:putative Zn(II)2Cys6 transcription factor [Aspergillus mulundensis]RDW89807.1 putative Zn(II)2Cys6 transcription factor [Aspergillus mulundensis]
MSAQHLQGQAEMKRKRNTERYLRHTDEVSTGGKSSATTPNHASSASVQKPAVLSTRRMLAAGSSLSRLPTAMAAGARDMDMDMAMDRASQHSAHPEHTEQPSNTSSRNSPEPSSTDQQGHYIGPASGVSFLLRVQKRLHDAISFAQPSGSIFTFGDAPLHLPDFNPSFCMMLPRDDAQKLIDRYFDFAMPTYRFLHRPTVQEWFAEFYETLGVMRDGDQNGGNAKVALLFMIFALGRVYMPDDERPGPADLSARYYLAAEHQLSQEKGSIRLSSVQARLTQCYYLLSQSRINHCWSLFGTVSHLALAIGLNRNRKPDPATCTSSGSSGGMGMGVIETECRRRTFWCAYTLDTYLSAALGRPRSFHDEDIDAEFPACVEDHQLSQALGHFQSNPRASSGNPTLSTMLAPLAHTKIARIISRILRDLYSIRPISDNKRLSAVQSICSDLAAWRADLAWFLDADVLSASLIIPIFQRQRNVLNLTYWHSIILTHRPFVLGNFARVQDGRSRPSKGGLAAHTEESVKACLNASLKIVEIIDEIAQNRQLLRALWITSYFAFNATIMLYIHVIQSRVPRHMHLHSMYFSAAARCQNHLSAIAERGSLSERYCLVLEELRGEALRRTGNGNGNGQCTSLVASDSNPQSRHHSHPRLRNNGHHGISIQPSAGKVPAPPPSEVQYGDEESPQTGTGTGTIETSYTGENSLDETGARLDFTASANNDMARLGLGLSPSDCPGWGQFTSMVSSGLGNMELFWGGEGVRF